MTGRQGFSRGVAWLALGNWTEQAVTFAVFVILARLLGAEAFGILAMAQVFVILSEFLVRETFSEGLIAQDSPARSDLDAAFWLLTGFGTVLAVALWAMAGPIASIYGEPSVEPLVRVLALTVPAIALTSVPVAILRRELRFRSLAFRAVAGVAVGGIVGIGMAATGYGVWSLVGQRLAQVGTNVCLAWFSVGWRPGLSATPRRVIEAARFGGQVLGLRASELAAAQLPTLLIGAGLGAHAAGLYAIAWKLVETSAFLIVTPLRGAAQPVFAAMSRGGGRAADLLTDISRLTGPISFPLFLGLAVVAGPLVRLGFGTGWGEAAPVLAGLAAAGAFFSIEKVQQAFCLAAGRAVEMAGLGWLTVWLMAVLCWIALDWGIVAVAWAVSLAYVLPLPLRFAVTARIGGLRAGQLAGPYVVPFAASAAMAVLVFLAMRQLDHLPDVPVLLAGVAIGVVTYAALAALFFRDRISLLRTFLPGRSGKKDM